MAYPIAASCILAVLSLPRTGLAETSIVSHLAEESALKQPSMQDISAIFRLGSGADGSSMLLQKEPNKVTEIVRSKSPPTTPVEAGRPKPGGNTKPVKAVWRLKKIATGANPFLLLLVLILMMPAGVPNLTGGNRDFNYRIPPSWSPEHEGTYSFRAYMTDLSIWIMLTDLQPHQQCAAIVMRLGGSAREMARMITPQEMMNGGVQNGVVVDPVTYLMGALHQRFSALEEESRLTCMTEMSAFARRLGEHINSLLARYEAVRQRAAVEGHILMSTEGCSL